MTNPLDGARVERAARLGGGPVAEAVRASLVERRRELDRAGVRPTLATVVASRDPADERFVELKHEAAAEVDISVRDVRFDPGVAQAELLESVERLGTDPGVHGVFVQAPLPDQVDPHPVRRAVEPGKDVDCFHPENLGRLVAGEPRFLPATTAAVLRLLTQYDVAIAGEDVVVVGRSAVIGRPLANLLWRKRSPGDATVTVCHSRTRDLGRRTRGADVVITAAGEPGLVDGSMLTPGTTVVDVSATRRETADGAEYVGDVDSASAAGVVDALTPVAAERAAGLDGGGTPP